MERDQRDKQHLILAILLDSEKDQMILVLWRRSQPLGLVEGIKGMDIFIIHRKALVNNLENFQNVLTRNQ